MTLHIYQVLGLFIGGCILGWFLRIMYEYMKGDAENG